METGGQFSSGAGPCGFTIGTSSLAVPPPNRLLKRSVIDCAEAGAANRPQPIASSSATDAVDIILRVRNAVMILGPGPSSLGRVIAAQWRRTQGIEQARSKASSKASAAKILVQQAEQQMVLPDAVDAEIAPCQSLAGKPAFLQYPDRGRVGGNAGGLDAVQIEFAEQRRQQHPQRRRHVAAMGVGLADPVADGAGLHDAAPDV